MSILKSVVLSIICISTTASATVLLDRGNSPMKMTLARIAPENAIQGNTIQGLGCGALSVDSCLAASHIEQLYTKQEVDSLLAPLTPLTARVQETVARMDDVSTKIAQDQQQLRRDVHDDLTDQIGSVLTPQLRDKIIDSAAEEATKRVLRKLASEGVGVISPQ